MARRKKKSVNNVATGTAGDQPSPCVDVIREVLDDNVMDVIGHADAGKPSRISGDELAGRLRQERREKRLAEKGY